MSFGTKDARGLDPITFGLEVSNEGLKLFIRNNFEEYLPEELLAQTRDDLTNEEASRTAEDNKAAYEI